MHKNIYYSFDEMYKDLINYITKEGTWSHGSKVRTVYEDGTPAHYLAVPEVNFTMKTKNIEQLDLFNQYFSFPAFLPTTRKAAWKSSLRELKWIWFLRSNNVDELEKMGCKYWNEWKKEDGTIGPAYGKALANETFQFNNQVDYIIHEIKNNPNSRRILTELWIPKDLKEMALTPCVHLTQWNVIGKKLHLSVRQRSCDVALGMCSNLVQYQVLHQIIAHECNLEVGDLNWSIGNAHIYDRHMDDLLKQVRERKSLPMPTMKIPKFKNVYELNFEEILLEDYKVSGEPIKYEIAI